MIFNGPCAIVTLIIRAYRSQTALQPLVRVAGLEPARAEAQQIFLLLYVTIAEYYILVVVWTMSSPYLAT